MMRNFESLLLILRVGIKVHSLFPNTCGLMGLQKEGLEEEKTHALLETVNEQSGKGS